MPTGWAPAAGLCVFGGLWVDMWRLVHQWSFLLFLLYFDCFDCFWRLVHCWYSLGRHVTIGTPMVIFAIFTVFWVFVTVFDDWYTVGTVLVDKRTVKTAKMAIAVPIITCLSRLYQPTKQSKDSQNSKITVAVPIVTCLLSIQRQITWKWYNIQVYLQWPTNRKSHMIYRSAPFSMILNDPCLQFQGRAILWRWISHRRFDIQT